MHIFHMSSGFFNGIEKMPAAIKKPKGTPGEPALFADTKLLV